MGLFDKIKKLSVFSGFFSVSEDFYEELEESLILSDMGMETTEEAVEELRRRVKERKVKDPEEVKACLREILAEMLTVGDAGLDLAGKPAVLLMIGVNGVGKTTTIGKLARRYRDAGKKVLLAAADTFRAAAAEQLTIWAERAGVDVVRHEEGSDPAAVVYDAIAAAKARKTDLIIVDTAGRLHNKQNLMNELSKIRRIISRELPDADVETLLVIDATTGQNGLLQARSFRDAADLSGVVLTKLDGTAKGGIVFSIARELELPVKFIGVGEQQDDLLPFEPRTFAEALLR